MKFHRARFFALATCAVFMLAGCATVPQEDLQRRASEIRVYRLAELSGTPYESVGHVWVDSWRTAFWPPTYPSQEEAEVSLRAEAARLGANGLVNVVCLDQGRSTLSGSAEPAILCYANAIRVRASAG